MTISNFLPNLLLRLYQNIIRSMQNSYIPSIFPTLKSEIKMYLFAAIVAMSSLETGYYYVLVSIIADPIAKYNELEEHQLTQKLSVQLSLATSAIPLGSFIGSLIYKQIIQKIQSENRLMTICDYLIIIFCLANMISLQIKYLTILRFLIGITVGISSVIVPIYLTSIAPLEIKGRLGSLNQLFLTVGIAIAYAMGLLMKGTLEQRYQDVWWHDQQILWRIIVCVPIVFCLIRIIGTRYFDYDCLQRHIKNGQIVKLQNFIDTFYIKNTLNVSDLIAKSKFNPKKSDIQPEFYYNNSDSYYCNIKKWSNGFKQRTKISIIFCILNQFCGINAIIFYANQIFDQISNGNQSYGYMMSFYLGMFQIIATLLGGAMMDKFGRKKLAIVGISIVIFSLFTVFYILNLTTQISHHIASYAVFLHIGGYSLSIGPITPTYISQILQDISPYITFLTLETIFISLVSQILTEQFGIGKIFLVYALITLSCLIYIEQYMIESKGKTRKELQIEYQRGKQMNKQYTKVEAINMKSQEREYI